MTQRAALLVLTALSAFTASVSEARAPISIGIAEREYRISTYRKTVKPGPVKFNVTNFGEDAHNLVVEAPDGTRVGRVWSVVTGAHVDTWDFSTAQVQWQPGVLGVQRNQPQFIFVELRVCTNAFCD